MASEQDGNGVGTEWKLSTPASLSELTSYERQELYALYLLLHASYGKGRLPLRDTDSELSTEQSSTLTEQRTSKGTGWTLPMDWS